MRVIHTSDWHIGKILNEFSLIEDQKYILDQLKQLIIDTKADVLVIAGDLFDRKVPPAYAVELLDRVLSSMIAETQVKILAIGGNHDSAQRLSFASGLYRQSGLYMCSTYHREIEQIEMEDEHGKIIFHLLPFVDAATVRADYGDDSIRTENDAIGRLLADHEKKVDQSVRNVLIAHGFFTNCSSPNGLVFSEETNIGGSDAIDVEHLKAYDYVALGHIHTPQRVTQDWIRYSGSLLKYSVAEANRSKSVTLIDFLEKGNQVIDQISLPIRRDLRIIKGSLEELCDYRKATGQQDYVFAQLCDTQLVIDAMSKLKSVYPNALGLRLDLKETDPSCVQYEAAEIKEKSVMELFDDFCNYLGQQPPDEQDRTIVEQAYLKAQEENV